MMQENAHDVTSGWEGQHRVRTKGTWLHEEDAI